MPFTIHRHPDAETFLRRAEPWLLRDEAEHNLMLGLAGRGREGLPPDSFFATIEEGDGIVGCAMRTPPLKLLVTRLPPGAEEPLADALGDAYGALPAVLGPEEEATAFARAWARRRGVRHEPAMRQRIYQLDAVVPPPRAPPGRLRRAEARDLELAVAWVEAFHVDTRTERTDPVGSVRRWSEAGDLFLWDDGEPRCMAAIVRRTPNGAAVAGVYTPPAMRARGYATACVAAVSQGALDAGARFCFLYTDLSNPTSNAIYTRIGYRAVCDVLDVVFGDAPARS